MPIFLKTMNDKERSIIETCLKAVGISIIIIVLLIVIMPKNDRNLVNILGVLGTVFSIAGVIIAIIQIRKVQAVSEAAEKAANEAKYDLKKVLTITEFAQVVALIRKVQQFVRDDKYELAIERISDIKDFLDRVEFLCSPQVDSSTLHRFKIKLDVNMNEIEHVLDKTSSIDKGTFMNDMEGLISMLNKMDNHIKNS